MLLPKMEGVFGQWDWVTYSRKGIFGKGCSGWGRNDEATADCNGGERVTAPFRDGGNLCADYRTQLCSYWQS